MLNNHCHRVTTQLQLINIIIIITFGYHLGFKKLNMVTHDFPLKKLSFLASTQEHYLVTTRLHLITTRFDLSS